MSLFAQLNPDRRPRNLCVVDRVRECFGFECMVHNIIFLKNINKFIKTTERKGKFDLKRALLGDFLTLE